MVDNYSIDYRIGDDFDDPPPDGTGDFIRVVHRGIPLPDRWTFSPYSVVNIRGDGRSVGDGYPGATWTWTLLNQVQLENLLIMFASDADASVEVKIRTPAERGRKTEVEDYTAIMHRPLFDQGKTSVDLSTFPVWSEVTVRFTKLEPR